MGSLDVLVHMLNASLHRSSQIKSLIALTLALVTLLLIVPDKAKLSQPPLTLFLLSCALLAATHFSTTVDLISESRPSQTHTHEAQHAKRQCYHAGSHRLRTCCRCAFIYNGQDSAVDVSVGGVPNRRAMENISANNICHLPSTIKTMPSPTSLNQPVETRRTS